MAAPGRRNAERAARHRRIRITEDLALSEAPARERRPWRTVGASARQEVRAVTGYRLKEPAHRLDGRRYMDREEDEDCSLGTLRYAGTRSAA